jgi:hypothetical protein
MTYRDDDQSIPNSPHAMVDGPRPGDALVPQTNGMPPAPVYTMPAAPPGQDVLRGGMDVNGFLNCLRRRWMLALCMGMVAAVTAAGILWLMFPEASTAMALFQVSSQKPTVVFEEAHRNESQDFAVLQRTGIAQEPIRIAGGFALAWGC